MKIFYHPVTYTKVKDNIGMIVLVPTIIGGVWQIFELTRIGTAYLRFFSITQLVPDGILILFCFGLILGASWMILKERWSSFIAPFSGKQNKKPSPVTPDQAAMPRTVVSETIGRSKKSKGKEWVRVLIFICVLFAVSKFILGDILDMMRQSKIVPLFVWIILSFYVSLSIVLTKEIFEVLFELFNKKINAENKAVEILISLVIMALFIFSIKIIIAFHYSFTFPADFKNSESFQQKIKSKTPSVSSTEILYFNDKYIFVQVTDTANKNYVQVFRFEEFTTD